MENDQPTAARWPRLSGLEMVRGFASGRFPWPDHAAWLGYAFAAVEPGRVTLTWTPTAQVHNSSGHVHGGYLAMVLDDAGALAAATIAEEFRPMLTLSLNIDFVRPVLIGGAYTVTGQVVHGGRQRIIADAEVTGADGRPHARGHGGFLPNLAFDQD